MLKLKIVYVLITIAYLNLYGYQCQNLASFTYHNYNDLTKLMSDYASKFPTKTYLYSIGKSVQGRDLWVLAIADTNPSQHVLLRPEVKYIGNMHGNEVPSKEILLHLIDYLLNSQGTDPSVDYLLKNTRIHIMPSMNPDGFEISQVGDCESVNGRYNANGYDLNRNFPDLFENNTNPIQVETRAVMDWLAANSFVLSANFHGGSLVVNYPYDNYKDANDITKNNPSADDDVFKTMALNYSANNVAMRGSSCGDSFPEGITNGAEWYPVTGGMQDYNYWGVGCMEVTIEISCCKYPSPSGLQTIWNQNKKALVDYLKYANKGVRGIIQFENGLPAANITVKIDSRSPYFKTNNNGEYYRILLPGTYKLSLSLNCDDFYETNITIPNGASSITFNITLSDSVFRAYQKTNGLNRFSVFCDSTFPTIHLIDLNLSNKLMKNSIFTYLFGFIFTNFFSS